MGKREEEEGLKRAAIYCWHWSGLCICFVSDTGAAPPCSPSSPGKLHSSSSPGSSTVQSAAYQDPVARS